MNAQRGGGNRLKPSHNHGLHLFLGCLDAKMRRGAVCYGNKNSHTEDNSPKYRMVGKIVGLESPTYSCNCHPEFNSGAINVDLKPLSCLSGTLSPWDEGKEENIGDMKQNNFPDKLYSLFTTQHSLKSAAFTLAEVLVTLGIIGVVSAMTVPTLMQNYQRQSYVTQLHKVYNELQQAFLRYMTDRNAINMKEAGFNSQAAANSFIESTFKVVNSCGTSLSPCFKSRDDYKKLTGETIASWGGCQGTRTHYSLASGASLGVCYRTDGTSMVAEIFVDANGQKGPNIVGRDLMNFFLYNDGTIDDYSGSAPPISQATRESMFNSVCAKAGNAGSWHGCLGKLINDNWQMTY